MSVSDNKELIDAFYEGNKKKALELLKITKNPAEIRSDTNWTLLHYAARRGWIDICHQLVEVYQVDPHVKTSSNGWTALHWASNKDQADVVKYLVNQIHCDPLIKNKYGDTPFDVSKGDSRHFLQDLIDKAKTEGTTVVEYTKQVSSHDENRPDVIDYTPYLEKAAAQGTVTTRLSSIGLFGAAGTGKTSTARLLTDQEPVTEHDSTPLLKPEEYYKTTSDNGTITGTHNDDDDDSEWDSEDEEPATKPPEIQQNVRAARHDVLIVEGGKINEWMPATQEVLVHRLGNCVHTLAHQESTGTTQSSDSVDGLIDGFSIVEREANDHPSNDSGSSSEAGASAATRTASVTKEDPIACVKDITRSILEFVKSGKDLQKLGITHFVSMCDTGGQAAFLDIAPALLSFNSVNLVLVKLNERLDDPAKFFYSVNGKVVGVENRKITTRSLVYSMVSCKSKIMKPRIKGKMIEGSQYRKPVFMILGTHLDEYKKMEASGKCQSKEEINATLKHDLSGFEDCLHTNKDKMVFSLNTRARDGNTRKLAAKIRKLVMGRYVQVEIPVSWYIFHLAMLKIKQSNKENNGMISLSDLIRVGTMLIEMPPGEIQAALQYFHDLRICLYFPSVASKVVFTDSQFLFDKISEIFAFSQSKGKMEVTAGDFKKFKKYGIFNKKLLENVCKKGFDKIFSLKEFLSLLCHLFILSKIPDTEDYFMPCLLAEHPNPFAEFQHTSSSSIEPLLLSWDASVPNGLFTSLTTSIQADEGFNNIHFTMSPSDEQYRNVITLNCSDLACQVKLIECTAFIAVAAFFSHSKVVTDQCVKLRRAILSCIGKIGEKFNWMPLLAYPEEAFLCKIEQCISRDEIHFCYLDASHKVISCAKRSLISAPAHPDSHLVWWGQIGSSLDHSNQLTTLNLFKLLQDKSAQWAKIGREFDASNNYRETLLRNPALDDDQRLEAVLDKWLESTSAPTWAEVHKLLTDSLNFKDIARRMQTFLDQH